MNSTICIGRPRPEPFPITPDQFHQVLTDRFPEAPVARMDLPRGVDGVTFAFDIDGEPRSGTFYSNGYLVLEDGDGAVWAPTLTWFLTLIPGHYVEMMVEVDSPSSVPIPADATPADVIGIYEGICGPCGERST